MSARDNKNLHKRTKEQEELLAKVQWGSYEHVQLTKHCLLEYTVHKVKTIDEISFQVHWNKVGSDSQDASDRERIARFISNLPSQGSRKGGLRSLAHIQEWVIWKDHAIDIARYFLVGRGQSDDLPLKELKDGLIDKFSYDYLWTEVDVYENLWELLHQSGETIGVVCRRNWDYPFKSNLELMQEIIREDLEGEFSLRLGRRYMYVSSQIGKIAKLKRKDCKGGLSNIEQKTLYRLIDQHSAFPTWLNRVLLVSEALAAKGDSTIQKHLATRSKNIDALSKLQIKRDCDPSLKTHKRRTHTWNNGILKEGVLGWDA